MIPCIKNVRSLDQLNDMPQAQLIKTCAECAVSSMCDMGTTILSEIKAFKADHTTEEPIQQTENLEELARTSMNFSEYSQKAEQRKQTRQPPQIDDATLVRNSHDFAHFQTMRKKESGE